MKKLLGISGVIEYTREDVYKLIEKDIVEREKLNVVKMRFFPDKFESVAIEVASGDLTLIEEKKDEIIKTPLPRPEHPTKTKEGYKKGFKRPNYGIGRDLAKFFDSHFNAIKVDELFAIMNAKYPNLDRNQLIRYTTDHLKFRTGIRVIHNKDEDTFRRLQG